MCTQLVVAGCMVQRYGKKLLDLLPEVDIFLGTSHYGKLKEILLASRNGNPRKLWISTPRWLHSSQTPRLRSTLPFSAYVKIADGCSNHCTYCMIPHLRGPYRSRSIQDIVREVTILVSEGVKEINLIAQDTTAFGMDRQNEGELIPLLEQLDDIPHLEWIRILYVYPDRVTPLLLQTMAQSRKVVPYLDIPLQHSVPSILNAMRRKGSFVNPEKLIDLIRKHIPAMVLRTSFIVGFPGKTDQDFLDLLGFVERMKFQHVGVFAFSPEIGTRAAKMAHQVRWKRRSRGVTLCLKCREKFHDNVFNSTSGKPFEFSLKAFIRKRNSSLQGVSLSRPRRLTAA
jgi:ribosomal protein S12 methylthiotransferase